ncbi:hypothetical protein GGF50DRAFT_68004 [Schizophyllum commune]
MLGPPATPPSSVKDRPLRDRLLPSWIIGYFSRGCASPSAPIASSATDSSPRASGDPSDGPRTHPQPSSSVAVVASPSISSSPGKRPGMRERLSISKLYRRLSRALTSSSRGSTPSPVRSDSPQIVSDALQMPPSSATDTGSGPSILRLSSIDVTPEMAAPSSNFQDASTNAPTAVSLLDVAGAPAADPMAEMWTEAVAEWQRKTGLDLTVPDAIPLRSKEAVIGYIGKMEEEEQGKFASGRWKRVHDSFIPLARIFEKVCIPIGDTLCSTASEKTHEELEQIAGTFDEIKTHSQVVEAVSMRQGDLLHDASVKLLIQLIAVLQVIVEMKRAGRLRQLWLSLASVGSTSFIRFMAEKPH